jgi:hypothetical protein
MSAKRKVVPFRTPGQLAGDAAMAQVLANEREAWKARATAFLMREPVDAPFSIETLRLALEPIVGRPHHHNTWGAMTNSWIRAGLIIPLELKEHMRTEKSHGRSTDLYEWPTRPGIECDL